MDALGSATHGRSLCSASGIWPCSTSHEALDRRLDQSSGFRRNNGIITVLTGRTRFVVRNKSLSVYLFVSAFFDKGKVKSRNFLRPIVSGFGASIPVLFLEEALLSYSHPRYATS